MSPLRSLAEITMKRLKATLAWPPAPEASPTGPTYDWRAWGIGAWLGLMLAYATQAVAAAKLQIPFGPAPIAIIPGLLAAYLFARPLQGRQAAPLKTLAQLTGRVTTTCGLLAIALLLLAPAPAATGSQAAAVTEALITAPLTAVVELTITVLAIAGGVTAAARLRRTRPR